MNGFHSNPPDRSAARGSRWIRIAALILGAALLLWLPLEDTSILPVLIFGAAICLWGVVAFFHSLAARGKLRWFHYPLAGLLAGLLVTPVSALLMVFKIGVHGHEVPDFSFEQVLDVLGRTPFWALGGLLLGLGVGIWQRVEQNEP